jgi:uncharacterized oligopeptide transporter (OPT) family protein
MIAMDKVYHIGSAELPAPQAGLMALMSKGIVGGDMAWPLVIAGIFFAFALILIKAPSPMLIAVGMYLPFHSTAAIFVGGIIRWLLDRSLAKRKMGTEKQSSAVNTGILLSSGFIAGEALVAVLLAFWVLGQETIHLPVLPRLAANPWLGMLGFVALLYLLIKVPLKAAEEGGAPSVKVE